jgi:hypothetical protein
MRSPIAAALVLLVLAAGCAPGRDDELKELVDEVAPTGARQLGCGWETRWGSDSGSVYDCYYVVPGRPRDLGRLVLTRVAEHGFTVSCRTAKGAVELLGMRDGGMFYVGIASRAAATTSAVSQADIPPGYVLVELAATKDEDASIISGSTICATAR